MLSWGADSNGQTQGWCEREGACLIAGELLAGSQGSARAPDARKWNSQTRPVRSSSANDLQGYECRESRWNCRLERGHQVRGPTEISMHDSFMDELYHVAWPWQLSSPAPSKKVPGSDRYNTCQTHKYLFWNHSCFVRGATQLSPLACRYTYSYYLRVSNDMWRRAIFLQ